MDTNRRMVLVLFLQAAIVAGLVVAGTVAHSVGLLSAAGHNLADVGAVALSLAAIRLATRKPTASRSFGYHRSTVLAAQANAAAILAISVFIVVAAVARLGHTHHVRGGVVLLAALGDFALNGISVLLIRERHHHGHAHTHDPDLNIRAAMLHLAGDAFAAAGVAVAGAIILITGRFDWLDPAISIAIAVLIAWEAVKLVRATTDVLLESTPPGLDTVALLATMRTVSGVDEVHDLHAWSLSSDVRALSAHLVLAGHPTLEEAQVVGDAVKRVIALEYGISHATLELECEACVDADVDPCAIEDLDEVRAQRGSRAAPG
ncbi:MAG: cation transporter [Actinobacteria bacterium]|nr:cation transporter [Actinomycetota bacterium]